MLKNAARDRATQAWRVSDHIASTKNAAIAIEKSANEELQKIIDQQHYEAVGAKTALYAERGNRISQDTISRIMQMLRHLKSTARVEAQKLNEDLKVS